ncbi:MAG: hypothetical protein B7O98_08930 [Zestosphaera tikiterensis]|uniref:Glycosyl transferase family 1 n=1 Tax=Zestosphaera tikiterensis TaxID=1973259 RepID=A0A2R7Y459_9CREN|nr:MAG: hypothetical protein B7O98_08930 [Zestosphaera tikiterensis]
MRIAIACTYYPFPPSIGGVEAIARNVARELAKRGHEVHIVTSNLDVTTQRPVTDLGIEEREGVIVHKLKPSNFRVGYARTLEGLKETIAKIKPDIVHAHNLHPHLFQLTRWKKDIGYRLMAELHYPEVNLDFVIQKLLMKPAMYLLKKVSNQMDLFIVHTKLERSWLEKCGVEGSRIRVVFTPHISDELLKYISRSRSGNEVLFVGRLVFKKGVHILIKAFHKVLNKIPNAKLLIIGPEDSRYGRYLRELVRSLDLEKAASFLGSVDETKKIELMASAAVFSLPTLADYHPIALLEAQALGTPVVSTRVGAIPEIVIDGETGLLVEPGSIDQLAEAIEMLLTDERLRRKMSQKAREWSKNFTLDKAVSRLEGIYKLLL